MQRNSAENGTESCKGSLFMMCASVCAEDDECLSNREHGEATVLRVEENADFSSSRSDEETKALVEREIQMLREQLNGLSTVMDSLQAEKDVITSRLASVEGQMGFPMRMEDERSLSHASEVSTQAVVAVPVSSTSGYLAQDVVEVSSTGSTIEGRVRDPEPAPSYGMEKDGTLMNDSAIADCTLLPESTTAAASSEGEDLKSELQREIEKLESKLLGNDKKPQRTDDTKFAAHSREREKEKKGKKEVKFLADQLKAINDKRIQEKRSKNEDKEEPSFVKNASSSQLQEQMQQLASKLSNNSPAATSTKKNTQVGRSAGVAGISPGHAAEAERQMQRWLELVGCPELAERFIDEGYDLEFISQHGLCDDDLDRIGVSKLGLRKKLLSSFKMEGIVKEGLPLINESRESDDEY